ncbi:MAG: hypothetical protein A2W19_00930 [Spirochaetes bacterium RBG_16_49_21]|nr:MAG: hypothetical protein A2W19_00930 [Spirochaetes bacterium RBG_16_49_21]
MNKEKNKYFKLLSAAGISRATLDAVKAVDRDKFFDPIFSDQVYSMEEIPIGAGQKSEHPMVLARMIDLLAVKKEWRVLEVGTGSGYSTAVLAQLAGEVVTVEYYESLAMKAKERMIGGGCAPVRLYRGDATDFDGDLGEFDAAVIFAACVRTPYAIVTMLRPGGTAVFPMGPALQQQITHFVNITDEPGLSKNFRFYDLCSFDSIRGPYGWVDAPEAPPEGGPEEKPANEDPLNPTSTGSVRRPEGDLKD